MAVVCDALSVIVRVWTLEKRWPGGLAGYQAQAPNKTFCTDGVLARIGFMTPSDVTYWIDILQDQGLVFTTEQMGRIVADDIVVIDQMAGPTCHAPWVVTEVRDGVRWAWQAGREAGELAAPDGWTPASSTGMHFHANEDTTSMPLDATTDTYMTIDPSTGKTLFMAAPIERALGYEEHIRKAERDLASGRSDEAYRSIRRAEKRRALTPEHRVLAAEICVQAAEEADEQEGPGSRKAGLLWIEAARRWTEVTQLSNAPLTWGSWWMRAMAEFKAGDMQAARRSIQQAGRGGDMNAQVLLLRAQVAMAQGQSQHAVLTLTARAWDLADRSGDPDLVEDVISFRALAKEHFAQSTPHRPRGPHRKHPRSPTP